MWRLYSVVVSFAFGVAAQTFPTPTKSNVSAPASSSPAPTHPPIPPANTPALPSEFSDIPASVISCWDAYASYETTSSFLQRQIDSSFEYTFIPWNTTTISLSVYTDSYVDCQTIALPSLTTLCDGYPRALSSAIFCQTQPATYTSTISGEAIYSFPPWTTELDTMTFPTCTVADDYSPQCSRIAEAYTWRSNYLQSQTPRATGVIARPNCLVLNTAAPTAVPTCYLEDGTWEAFYWPDPSPTTFCPSNGTTITAPPTLTRPPRTAIVSGLTFTSPSVYYILRNLTLQTYIGKSSAVGQAYTTTTGRDVFAPSTTAPFLTIAQPESSILTISYRCGGSGRGRYCTYYASTGFMVADLATVRASEYCRKYDGCYEGLTIFQDNYTPSLGIPVTEIVRQNSVFGECVWTTPGARVRTSGEAAWNGGAMKTGDWRPANTGTGTAGSGKGE